MGRRFLTVLVLVGTLLGVAIGTAGSVAADTQYTCPDNSCSFSVPDFYSKLSSDDTSILFKDANSGGTFGVAIASDFPATATLDDAGALLVQQFSTSDGYQGDPKGVQQATIGGNPGRLFNYVSNNSSGTQVESAVFFTVYQGKLYTLIFATTPDKEDDFVANAKDVFDSWQFM